MGTAIDQGLFSWWTISTYLFWTNFLQHKDIRKAANNVRQNIMSIWWVAIVFWPGIIFSNLRFTPIEYQVLVINFASIFWNLFMSYKNQQGQQATLSKESSVGAMDRQQAKRISI